MCSSDLLLRSLEADLEAEADLPLADYDALVQLARAEGRRLRMGELAERLLITRSGVTRLVDRLVDAGLVERSTCTPDGRGAYAVLTRAGFARLRGALPVHLAHVDARFLRVIDPADLPAVERAMRAVAAATGLCTRLLDADHARLLSEDDISVGAAAGDAAAGDGAAGDAMPGERGAGNAIADDAVAGGSIP